MHLKHRQSTPRLAQNRGLIPFQNPSKNQKKQSGALEMLLHLIDTIHPIAPLVVYGVIVLLAGVLSIWLWPETKDIRIMQA